MIFGNKIQKCWVISVIIVVTSSRKNIQPQSWSIFGFCFRDFPIWVNSYLLRTSRENPRASFLEKCPEFYLNLWPIINLLFVVYVCWIIGSFMNLVNFGGSFMNLVDSSWNFKYGFLLWILFMDFDLWILIMDFWLFNG